MRKLLSEILTIYVDGDEVPGLLIYGLEPTLNRNEPSFPGHVWPEFVSLTERILYGDSWRARLWEVELSEIPPIDTLSMAIEATLDALIESGSLVAWVGLEGNFCDPPSLFMPDCMSGGVMAARSASGKRWKQFDTGPFFDPLSDDDLLALRAEAYPLASAE